MAFEFNEQEDRFNYLWTEAYDLGIEEAFNDISNALSCEHCGKEITRGMVESDPDTSDGWVYLEHPSNSDLVQVACGECDPT